MIRDLTESLKAILTQPNLPEGDLAAIHNFTYDRPGEPSPPTTPTINLFLYDIRENHDLRNNEPVIKRSNGDAVVQKPPRRIACSYLVTAWPTSGTDLVLQEHRLLTQVLQVFSRTPVIPVDLAVRLIKKCDPPVPLEVALGLPTASASEFWSSLGGKLRAALTVQATLAVPVWADEPPYRLVRAHKITTGERQPYPATALDPATSETASPLLVFGRVLGKDQNPAGGARVEIVELRLAVETLPDGSFRVGPVRAGTYTVRATLDKDHAEVTRTVPITSGPYDIPLA
jgi:hypothetical protein